MIPKRLALYWGGKLSFLRFMTVYTFKKFNPDWNIVVYYPEVVTKKVTWNTGEQGGQYDGRDFFDDLKKYAELIPISMTQFGFKDDIPEVHKAGLVRAWTLSEYGGLYCDMDIVFFKPVSIPEGTNIIQCYNPAGGYFSDGFLGCSEEGKPFYKRLFELTKTMAGTGYQSMGLNVWNSMVQRSGWGKDVWNIPMSLLYSLDSTHIPEIFNEGTKYTFPENAIGCHWYGGHPLTRLWENKIKPSNIQYDNVICRILEEIYNEND